MGKKNLERALAAAKPRLVSKDTTFTTTWRPFFLMPPEMWRRGVASGEFPPDAETVGINKLDYYHSKFGGPARVAPMVERLAGIGFEPVTLGERVLRVEPVIPMLVGRLFR